MKNWGLALRLLAAAEELREPLDELLTALRQEKMSPRQYQWMLGLAMREAMAAPERHPAGEDYWQVARALERLIGASASASDRFSADGAYGQLKELYPDRRLDQPEVLDKLRGADLATYGIDWLLVATPWAKAGGIARGRNDEPQS